MKRLVLILAVGLILFPNLSLAAPCKSSTEVAEDFPFPNTFQSAQILSEELCLIATDANPDFSRAEPVAKTWRDNALSETAVLNSVGIDIEPHIQTLYEAILDGLPFKNFEIDKTSNTYSVSGSNLAVIPDNSKCETILAHENCYDLLEKLQIALNTTNDAVNAHEITEVAKTIGLYSKHWENYFDKARSQTFIELTLNTYLYRNKLKKDSFVPPPNYQAILLHPSVVLEHVSAEDDGDKLKEAFSMEWVGINWWDLKLPFGASLVTTVSDRKDVNDFGHGVMLHIDNNYSIGVTTHSGDTGVLITLDLLKLFEDKKSNLEKFKEKAQQYF